jgi:parvulin-like peptidyl-prolyl isomerase
VGPLASGYGLHLVRLERLQPGGAPALADVRPLVEREWSNARREELARAFYQQLRSKYAITVQMPEGFRP